MQRRGVSAVLAGVLLTGMALPVAQANVADSQRQLQEIQAKHKNTAAQIQQLRSRAVTIEEQIQQLQNQVQQTQQQISDLQGQLQSLNAQIADTEQKLTAAEEQLQIRQDLLNQRLRAMYEDGTVSYLEVLLSSTSFSDFVDRLYALKTIAEQDKKLLEDTKKKRDQVQALKAQLEAERQQQQAALARMSDTKRQLEAQKQMQQEQLSQVQQAKQQQEQQYAQEQAAMDSLSAAIQAQLAAMQQNNVVVEGTNHPWLWPVPSSHTITSDYGDTGGRSVPHNGVDIGAPLGSPIVAVDDGVVVYAGPASGFGHWIVIRHANGLMSVYGHMYASGVLVAPGQQVKRGQVIGLVGSDGESTGPHLHFSVITGFSGGRMVTVNPHGYI
ncbi:peptidoglycan DD-metalloendopeptidase family protein [Kyrpidia sp.]|uniref:murein hydrolase activator EnvC family protein n=1 Tax=Kyrpidia sp. TaxID=2073077 RepID=UPI0025854E54|nr:peptidoglycan DD-metalloendopeptidase family protein [Kyrpidia sp.]MCL6575646.1 peptidoglycan DD-metalloendopeptidase family protein [Kyrpidia sp.]